MRRPSSQPMLLIFNSLLNSYSLFFLKTSLLNFSTKPVTTVYFQFFFYRKQIQETDDEEELIRIKRKSFRDVESITSHSSCMTISKQEHKRPSKDIESLSWGKYGVWRQEQRSGIARLKKQLKARWAMQKLIDEQLCRLQAHYSRAMFPIKMSNMVQLLLPKWAPPMELAAVSWLGDWRPSTILQFLLSLVPFLSDPIGVERTLSQLIHDVRVEEAVIDEEMTEIQATCVLHLPFGQNKEGRGSGLISIIPEFRKIYRVIVKAQNLRMKTLEVVVKKVLSHGDAAEFLVDFAGIQDAIRRFAVKNKPRQGPVCGKELGSNFG